jgi:aryl-alcohol dehydrogenase-like predicted oxidoreductase
MHDIMIGTWAWGTGRNGSKMVFGNPTDTEALTETFHTAVDYGFKQWDTAAVYGMGTCETFLGKLLQGQEDIFLSTKFFPGKRYHSGELTKSFVASCDRLGISYVNLFWIHVPNHLTENLKEAVDLVKAGKIGKIGISNVSLAHIKEAVAFLEQEGLSLGAVQNHFSLLRNDQGAIIDFCHANQIDYYAYMVLEQGALSGHYNAQNPFPRFSLRGISFPKRKFRKIEGLLDRMKELADKYDVDPSQIPVLWVIGKGTIPIVGLTKPSQAEKLHQAAEVSLTDVEIDLLEREAAAVGIRQQGVWEPQ